MRMLTSAELSLTFGAGNIANAAPTYPNPFASRSLINGPFNAANNALNANPTHISGLTANINNYFTNHGVSTNPMDYLNNVNLGSFGNLPSLGSIGFGR